MITVTSPKNTADSQDIAVTATHGILTACAVYLSMSETINLFCIEFLHIPSFYLAVIGVMATSFTVLFRAGVPTEKQVIDEVLKDIENIAPETTPKVEEVKAVIEATLPADIPSEDQKEVSATV